MKHFNCIRIMCILKVEIDHKFALSLYGLICSVGSVKKELMQIFCFDGCVGSQQVTTGLRALHTQQSVRKIVRVNAEVVLLKFCTRLPLRLEGVRK